MILFMTLFPRLFFFSPFDRKRKLKGWKNVCNLFIECGIVLWIMARSHKYNERLFKLIQAADFQTNILQTFISVAHSWFQDFTLCLSFVWIKHSSMCCWSDDTIPIRGGCSQAGSQDAFHSTLLLPSELNMPSGHRRWAWLLNLLYCVHDLQHPLYSFSGRVTSKTMLCTITLWDKELIHAN